MSMRATWVLTVVSETMSSAAISAFDSPRATSLKTSSSRAVSSSRPGGGGPEGGPAWANSWISRRGSTGGGARPRRRSPGAGRGAPRGQAGGDRRGEQRVAAGDDADAVGELLGRDVLEQEPGRTGAQR